MLPGTTRDVTDRNQEKRHDGCFSQYPVDLSRFSLQAQISQGVGTQFLGIAHVWQVRGANVRMEDGKHGSLGY
jgi:hypothetical protein